MTCRELTEFLNEYEADELTTDQRSVFDSHMAVCPACVAYLQNYRQTVALGQAAFQCETDELPANVPDELVQAILSARQP